MDFPSPPESLLPLEVLARLGSVEKQARGLLQQCADASEPFGLMLDVMKVTEILRACAKQMFSIQAEYWETRPEGRSHRLNAIVEETVQKTLNLAPFGIITRTKFLEAKSGIRRLLLMDLDAAQKSRSSNNVQSPETEAAISEHTSVLADTAAPAKNSASTPKDPHVDLLEKLVEKKQITIETWAADHKFARTTVFDWKAGRSAGTPLKGKVSDKKAAAIELAIREDAAALGLDSDDSTD